MGPAITPMGEIVSQCMLNCYVQECMDTGKCVRYNAVLCPAPKTSEGAKSYQVAGDHYLKCKIQPIDFILGNKLGFCEGTVVAYVTRWRDKGGVEDLRKAKQTLEFLIEDEERLANGR